MSDYDQVAHGMGFFDGEGHVGISKSGVVSCECEQVEPGPLFEMQTQFGGHVNARGTRDTWRWRISAQADVLFFLNILVDYSWGKKKHEARVALDRMNGKLTVDQARAQMHRIRKGHHEFQPK